VVNFASEPTIAENVISRIQEVSQKVLSLQVGYLGSIPYRPEVQRSTRDLLPVVAETPKGIFAECIRKMMTRFQTDY